ncbi:hypothetical protein [Methanosarcina spelaei]|nr:hypothetical protein [Methanosarcina spelaei]
MQMAVAELRKNKIFITMAYRLNTVRYIDQILAAVGSKIIQMGPMTSLQAEGRLRRPFSRP